MRIGVLDLVAIYLIPPIGIGILAVLFLAVLYGIVKFDWFRLDFTYDVLVGLKHRKRPLSFANVALLLLFDNGVQATLLYRISRFLHLRGFAAVAQVINKTSKALTNIDLAPSARIGRGLSLWHGTSIVVAQYAEIGQRCVIRQGCTVCGFGKVVVEDDVTFSHGSFVLEGNPEPIVVGKGAMVAANAVIVKSVPPGQVAAGVPADRFHRRPDTRILGVLLDLDRVLVDSDPAAYLALRRVLQSLGKRGISRKSFHRQLGRGLPQMLAALIGESLLTTASRLFAERFRELCAEHVLLRPGAKEVLAELRSAGMKIGVLSRHFRETAEGMIERLGLEDHLDGVQTADACGAWKPHPKVLVELLSSLGLRKENAVYVGSSSLDLRTGSNAALRVILLPGGAGQSKESLARCLPVLGESVVLDGLAEVPAYVRRLGSDPAEEVLSM
ncbi:MAG: HAD hydrolase-like protein [bacterium]